MTIGKASALALGMAGAMALGVWISPYVRGAGTGVEEQHAAGRSTTATTAAEGNEHQMARQAVPAVAPDSAALHARLKPVLRNGTNVNLAADGFKSGELFATVAHAAQNTDIPFVLLKHRVLNERKSLAAAIRESNPDLNAPVEAARARAEAQADLARISG